MSNHNVFLGLGSNLGDKRGNIEIAYNEIEKRIGSIISQSAFYITEPNGFISDNIFCNTVCEVATELDVNNLLNEIMEIEKNVGRTSKSIDGVYSDRIIDIDILMYNDLILETEALIVPHPRFHIRDFVLRPFAEISPDTIHPLLNKTIQQLIQSLKVK